MEISGPRLGFTSFRRKLEGFGGILSIGDLFNAAPNAHCDHNDALLEAARRMGQAPCPDPMALRRWAGAAPVGAIAVALEAARASGATHVVVKVAPGHLSSPSLARIVDVHRPLGILLLRVPIDQYISRQKAMALKTWRMIDMTAVKPRIDATAFRAARRRQLNQNRMGLYLLQRFGCAVETLRYETLDADGGDPMEILQQTFRRLVVMLVSGGRPAADLTRQDRSAARENKVANWKDFHAEMARRIARA